MKTLRFLLMVVAMVSVLGVYAQVTAKLPEPKMQSTSTMVGTGTTLPFAATEGIYVTGSTPGTYTSVTSSSPVHIRKGRPGDNKDPYDDPIGDGLWPLMLLACAYALMRVLLLNINKSKNK